MLDAVKSVGVNAVKSFHYRYDKMGNRLNEEINDGTAATITSGAYNHLNQITSRAPGGAVRFKGAANEPVISAVVGGDIAATLTAPGGNKFEGYAEMPAEAVPELRHCRTKFDKMNVTWLIFTRKSTQ